MTSLNIINADLKGQCLNCVCDALLRFAIESRLQRKRETQLESIRRLLISLEQSRIEQSQRMAILIADRGFGKYAVKELINEFGYSTFFVMRDHLIFVHTFSAASCLKIERDNLLLPESASDQHVVTGNDMKQNKNVHSVWRSTGETFDL